MSNTKTHVGRSSSWEKRRYLFEIYAKNFDAVKQHPHFHTEPDVKDVFICPLCFQYFTRDEVLTSTDDDEALVTLEHIPPEALGGKERTLTCRSCNNWAGHALDSHLIHQLALLDFLQGIPGASIDAKIKADDNVNLTATVRVSENRHLEIFYDRERSNPIEVEKFNQMEEPGPRTINMAFRGRSGKTHKIRRPECSLLRVAYLWAFSVFGYGFLINFGLQYIRSQIKNPTENILPNWGISQRSDYPDESLGINIITDPKELQSFLVVFDLRTSLRTIRYGVMLPGPSAPGTHIYENLQKLSQVSEHVSIRYKPIPDTGDFLRKPDLSFASHVVWKQWISNT